MNSATFPLVMIVLLGSAVSRLPARPPVLLTDRAFQRTLAGRISAEWDNVPLRELLGSITRLKKIAIVLDRRIDPTTRPTLTLRSVSLRDALQAIAKAVHAESVVTGNIVYIGPSAAVNRLPQLIRQRGVELSRLSAGLTPQQRTVLFRRATIHWNDLDTPRAILQQMEQAFRFKVVNPEQLPHDLWAGGTLPSVSRTQALSLLLIQFGRTFRWRNNGREVEIVPLVPPAKTPDQ